jgi:tetraacyldisaccharide 4'-kinase
MLNFYRKINIFTFIFLPLTVIFWLVLKFRYQIIKPKKFKQFSIVIGNATMGGAGKTPSAIAIGEVLSELKISYSFVTKGYQGKIIGPKKVNLTTQSVIDTGDEARLLAANNETFIAKKRHKAIEFLGNDAAPILLLDDGFQNAYIACNLNILIIDDSYLFGNKILFPSGPLRNTISWHINKADCIFIIKNSHINDSENFIKSISKNKPVFRLSPKLVSKIDLNKNYFAFSALANNKKFFNFLSDNDVNVVEHKSFKDHYSYKIEDIEKIVAYAKEKNLSIITTEKDFVKINGLASTDINVCKMKLEFIDKIQFIEFLKTKIQYD